jgi:hypothetical protein
MKALVQQLDTGLYFSSPGNWSPDHHEAFDFKSSHGARTYCRNQRLFSVQIVLKFGLDCYDLVLPPYLFGRVRNMLQHARGR